MPDVRDTTNNELRLFEVPQRHFACGPLTEDQRRQPGVVSTHDLVIGTWNTSGASAPTTDTSEGDMHTIGNDVDDALLQTETVDTAAATDDVAAFEDDSLPLSHNIPCAADADLSASATAPMKSKPTWNPGNQHPGTCPTRTSPRHVGNGGIINYAYGSTVTIVGLFLHFSPLQYWKDTVLKATNRKLGVKHQITFVDFVEHIALRLFMTCYHVGDVRQWWAKSPPSADGAPYRLGMFMSKRTFTRMALALTFSLTPNGDNLFHAQQQQQTAWNANMQASWDPAWLMCVDEGMAWNTGKNIPGGVFVDRKFWKLGNEHHSFADIIAVVIHDEIVMGRDRPAGLTKEYEKEHGTGVVALVLRHIKCVKGSRRVIILDSGFCVLMLIAALGNFGLFGVSCIKKRRHWPKFCDMVGLIALIATQAFGTIVSQTGVFLGQCVRLFVIKDQKYNHCYMANFGMEDKDGATQYRTDPYTGNQVTWRLTEFFTWCRRGRNNNDQNNQYRCQDGILAIERAWKSSSWETNQLVYYVAVSVANSYAVWTNHLGNDKVGTIPFRKTLAKELLLWCAEQWQDEDMKNNVHALFTGTVCTDAPGAPVATPAAHAAPTSSPPRPHKRHKKSAVQAGGDEHKTANVPAGHYNIVDEKDCLCGCGTKFRRTNDPKKSQRHWKCSLGCGASPSAYCVCALNTVLPGDRVPIMCTTGTCFARHVQSCCGPPALDLEGEG